MEKKTIADLKAAMWKMFKKLSGRVEKNAGALAADRDGHIYAFRDCNWRSSSNCIGKLDPSEYPSFAWKESLILVRDGKRVEDTPTPPANGFVPVRMEDFDAKNYIYRGIYLIVRDFKEETDGKYSASFEVSGSDIRRFKSLADLNAFLEEQYRALGGQKGDK